MSGDCFSKLTPYTVSDYLCLCLILLSTSGVTFCQFIQCSRMYIDWTRQHRTKNEERTSQYRMFKVGTECPGVYQSPSRNWTLDAGCVSRLAMLTVLRAAGGWSLVISPPDPRHPHPSPAPAGDM